MVLQLRKPSSSLTSMLASWRSEAMIPSQLREMVSTLGLHERPSERRSSARKFTSRFRI